VTSRQEKKNIVNALLRMHKEGIIERTGGKTAAIGALITRLTISTF